MKKITETFKIKVEHEGTTLPLNVVMVDEYTKIKTEILQDEEICL